VTNQSGVDPQAIRATSAVPKKGKRVNQFGLDTQAIRARLPLPDLILEAREINKWREDYVKTSVSINLRIQAVGFRLAAKRTPYKKGENFKSWCKARRVEGLVILKNDPVAIMMVAGQRAAFAVIEEQSNDLKKQLERIAEQLPHYDYAKSIRGLGAQSYAQIIAEAGDLALYSGPYKLNARMGLAVRDGRALKNIKGEQTGYCPRRRALMAVITANLVRAKSPLRVLYDERKAKIRAAHPEYSKGRCSNDAHRILAKRLLRSLWRVWNGQEPNEFIA
jgi:hypothetical protein